MAPSLLPLAFLFFVIAYVAAQRQVPVSRGHGPPPPPPFLQNAGPDKVTEFHNLLASSGGLTDKQIDEKVKEWIGRQSEDVQRKFAMFEAEKEKMQAAGEEAHKAAMANFSPEARAADEKLNSIATNPDLPAQEKAKQIQDFVQSLSNKVRDELEKAMMGGGR